MIITAHSGCDGTPDNSAQYLEYALTLSPDAIEIDIRRRGDGMLILWHDADPAGVYPQAITLETALALLQNHTGILNCDLKEPGLEEAVCQIHAQKRGAALVLSGSVAPALWQARPDLQALSGLYLNAEEVVPGLYETLQKDPGFAAEAGALCAKACVSCGAEAVNVHFEACTPAFMQAVQQQGVGVSAWTVNDLSRAKQLAEAGVLNITTRSAALLIGHFRAG